MGDTVEETVTPGGDNTDGAGPSVEEGTEDEGSSIGVAPGTVWTSPVSVVDAAGTSSIPLLSIGGAPGRVRTSPVAMPDSTFVAKGNAACVGGAGNAASVEDGGDAVCGGLAFPVSLRLFSLCTSTSPVGVLTATFS